MLGEILAMNHFLKIFFFFFFESCCYILQKNVHWIHIHNGCDKSGIATSKASQHA
uniref:Uncharacterized protein n=1 Tax=Octopus bimaculoides TaxID=37653 RepID=A0A0L8FX00_OCTBM